MNGDLGAVDYTAVLADLERRRDHLNGLIAGIRQLANLPPEDGTGGSPNTPGGARGGAATNGVTASAQVHTQVLSDTFFGMKAPQAIKTYLAISKRPQPIPDVVAALEKGGFISGAKDLYNNLYTALLRMEKADEVRKLPDGRWGLAEWYPAGAKRKPKSSAEASGSAPDASTDEQALEEQA